MASFVVLYVIEVVSVSNPSETGGAIDGPNATGAALLECRQAARGRALLR